MAVKDAVYLVDNGTGFDEFHFKTKAAQVICKDNRSVEVNLSEKAKKTELTNGTITVKKSERAVNLQEILTVLPATAESNEFNIWLPDGEEKELSFYGYFAESVSVAIRGIHVGTGNYSRVTTHTGATIVTTEHPNKWGVILGTVNGGVNVINMKIRRVAQKLYIDGTMGDGQKMIQFNGVGPLGSGVASSVDIQLYAKHGAELYLKVASKVGE